MKHIGIKLSVILATAMVGSSAFALKLPVDEPSFRQKILAAHDANRDGRLSDTEFAAMKAAGKQQRQNRRAQVMQRYDGNRTGKLEDAEKARRQADNQARLLPEFDTNRNGIIDPAERKVIANKRLQTGLAHRYVVMLLRFDANRDGSLQLAELPAGKNKGKGQKRLRAMDTNRDGAIDRTEFRAFVSQHMKDKATKGKHGKQGKQSKKVKPAKKIKPVAAIVHDHRL